MKAVWDLEGAINCALSRPSQQRCRHCAVLPQAHCLLCPACSRKPWELERCDIAFPCATQVGSVQGAV